MILSNRTKYWMPRNGLVATWNSRVGVSPSGTWREDSVGTKTLTLYGDASVSAGNGLVLDGTGDYAENASIDFGMNGATEMTVKFWFKTSSTTAYVARKAGASGWGILAHIILSGTLYWQVNQWVSGSFGYWPEWRTTATFNDGTWKHVIWCWKLAAKDATDMTLYVNGSPVALNFTANGYGSFTGMGDSACQTTIGASYSHTSPMNGSIDGFTIYNRKWTSTEVTRDYAVTLHR